MGLFSNTNDAVTRIKVNYDGKEAERGLSSLKKTIGAVVSVYALKQLATYTWELGKLGAQAETVEKNFARFAQSRNRSVDDMMSQLRRATMGMVDDMQLQQKAMQAMIGGVKFDDLIVAMEYVTKFASATGQDINVKMQSTMTGLARKSAQFLDDIGIQVMGSKDVVSDAINQMKEKMDQFATSEEDASTKSEQLNTKWKNLRKTMGELLLPAFERFTDLLSDAIDKVDKLHKGSQRDIVYNKIRKESIKELTDEMRSLEEFIPMYEKMGSETASWVSANGIRTEKLGIARVELKRIKELIEGINKELGKGAGSPREPGVTTEPDEEAIKRAKRIQEMLNDENLETRKKGLKELEELEKQHQTEMDWIYQNGLDRRLDIQQSADDTETMLLQQSAEGRKQLVYREFLERYLAMQEAGRDTTELEAWVQQEMTKIDEEESDKRIEQSQKEFDFKRNMMMSYFNSASSIINSLTTLSSLATQKELSNLDNQKMSRRRYEKEKEKILKEAHEKNKKFARLQQMMVIARALSDAYAAALGSAKDTFGGPASRAIAAGLTLGAGLANVAVIEAQMGNFQRGFLGEVDRIRKPDELPAMIGKNEAVIPGPQYAMHEEDVRAIVNNTANTAQGLRNLRGGSTVNNFYGLSENQVRDVIREQERRNYTGRLL